MVTVSLLEGKGKAKEGGASKKNSRGKLVAAPIKIPIHLIHDLDEIHDRDEIAAATEDVDPESSEMGREKELEPKGKIPIPLMPRWFNLYSATKGTCAFWVLRWNGRCW